MTGIKFKKPIIHFLVGVFVISSFLPLLITQPVSADPFGACGASGYLFQYPDDINTQVYEVDLATGEDVLLGTIPNHALNAVGYNSLDGYFYGHDEDSNEVVQIGENLETTVIPIPVLDLPVSVRVLGEVDDNGHYWIAPGQAGADQNWYQIDLAPGSPTYGEVLNSGPMSIPNPNLRQGPDWAFSSDTGLLYRLMNHNVTDVAHLVSFDRATGNFTDLGSTGISVSGVGSGFGAVYAGPDGYIYAANNLTGEVYRVNTNTLEVEYFSTGPASSNNDGARCFSADIGIDFGDAEDTYGTTLASDGARHTFLNSLRLGGSIDVETDASTPLNGLGDDQTGTDDETSVDMLPPINTLTNTYDIVVDARNNSSQDATLAAWLDINANGTFENNERQTTTVPAAASGNRFISWAGITPTAGDSALRVRFFGGILADPQPTGPAADGEVEDYALTIDDASLLIEKTVDRTTAEAGDVVNYTITVHNQDTVAKPNVSFEDNFSDQLDDATYNNDLAADMGTASYTEPMAQWDGSLDPDETATITYSFTVNDPPEGDLSLINTVVNTSAEPSNCDENSTDTRCMVIVEIDEALANTGSNQAVYISGAFLLALTGTGVALYFRNSSKLVSFSKNLG